MIDLNGPDNSTDHSFAPLIRLWRGVITTAARDSSENAQEAYDNLTWIKTDYAVSICDRANIDYSIVLRCFKKMNDSADFRSIIADRFRNIRVTTSRDASSSFITKARKIKAREEYVQTKLF